MTKTHTVRGDLGMDGSASTSVAERARSQVARAFVSRTANEASAQSELFEQLLSLSFTVQPPPAREPEPPDSDSSIADRPSSTTEDKAASDVEEENDSEPSLAISAPSVPSILEKPLEPAGDQSQIPLQTATASVNATEFGTNSSDENLTATTDHTISTNQALTVGNEQSITDETQIAASEVATPLSVPQSTEEKLTAEHESQDNTRNKKAVTSAAVVEGVKANPSQSLTTKNESESDGKLIAKADHELAKDPTVAISQEENGDDRRGERREKWFENKGESTTSRTGEHSYEPSLANSSTEELSLPTIVQDESGAQSSVLNATASIEASVAVSTPATATPAALPAALSATLSVVPQNIAATQVSTTSAASTESTVAISAAPTRSVGSQAAKPNANEKATEPSLTQQERVRVIQRIARSFNRFSSGGGTINLRLHPEQLGSVSVQVRLEGRSLAARLSTETTAARDAIMKDLPALRQRLADQGFDVTKFQVDVAGNGADASFGQFGGQSQSGQFENRPSAPPTDYRRVAASRQARAAATRQIAPATTLSAQRGAGIDLHA